MISFNLHGIIIKALLPTFWTEKGVRIGFLGLCNRTGRQWNFQPFLDAGYNKPGFAYLLPDNLDRCISYTRPLSDIVIVQTHSGDEYLSAPYISGGGAANLPIEADSIGPNDPPFKFRNEPTVGKPETMAGCSQPCDLVCYGSRCVH